MDSEDFQSTRDAAERNHKLTYRPGSESRSAAFTGTLIDQFHRMAESFPLVPAIVTPDARLTYQELDTQSDRLAASLTGDDRSAYRKPVMLLADHRAPAIVGLLGILKAGGHCAPIDPDLPPRSLRSILNTLSPTVVLAAQENAALARSLTADSPSELLIIEDALKSSRSAPSVEASVTIDDYACIYFTSGSTGEPKGVIHDHKTLMNWAMTDVRRLGFGPDDRFALLFRLPFSASRISLYGALLSGATLYVYDVRNMGVSDLWEAVAEDRISVLSSFPSFFRQACQSVPRLPSLPNLRLIHVAGEAARSSDVKLFQSLMPEQTILTVQLGSTEAGPITEHMFDHSTETDTGVASNGYPVQDKSVLIIGDDGQALPNGQIGQIVVQSPFLSVGYWQSEELNAAKFATIEDKRSFLSGDLGMIRSDGTLHFIGREDTQVKINGHRVELGEIDSALASLDWVNEAVAAIKNDEQGKPHLIAYYTADEQTSASLMAFRSALLPLLPDVMIPMEYVHIEELPRTSSGKIDRAALPAPDFRWLGLRDTYLRPRTIVETKLVSIWERALGISPIGIRDQFVELGGVSLDAIRILSEIKQTFHQKIDIEDFFDAGTVQEQAQLVRVARSSGPRPSLVPISLEGSRPSLYCFHPMGGLVRLYDRLSKFLGPDQPVLGLRAQGLSGSSRPLDSVEAMSRHYVKEIREYQPSGPYIFCGFSFGGAIAYEAARQLHDQGFRDSYAILIDTKMDYPESKRRKFEHSRRLRKRKRIRLVRKSLAILVAVFTGRSTGKMARKAVRVLRRETRRSLEEQRRRLSRRFPRWASHLAPQTRVKLSTVKATHHFVPKPLDGKHVFFIKASRTDEQVLDIWRQVVPNLHVIEVGGGHKDLLRGDSIDYVSTAIRNIIDRILAEPATEG